MKIQEVRFASTTGQILNYPLTPTNFFAPRLVQWPTYDIYTCLFDCSEKKVYIIVTLPTPKLLWEKNQALKWALIQAYMSNLHL